METTKRGAGQIALAASVMLAASVPSLADAMVTPHQRHGQDDPQDQASMLRIDRLPGDGDWHDDDPPYLFDGQWLQAGQSLQTQRAVHVRQAAGIQVSWPHTLELAGAIENTPGAQQGLRKTGHGTLVLSAANHYRGNTELYQGALQLTHAAALGNPLRALAASTGTRLVFAPGIHVRHGLQFNSLPTHPGLALEAGDSPWEPQAVQWSVDAGSAAYTGELIGSAALHKLGGGILLLGGNAAVYDGPLDLAEGGLGLYALFGGAVTVRQGALLGGNGGVGALVVENGGLFAPGIRGVDGIAGMNGTASLAAAYGMPGFLGHEAWTFRVQGTLHLREQAVMRVQAFPDGRTSLVRVGGVARLGGTLLVLPAAGDWPQQSRHVVLEAGQLPADSRFAQVRVLPWQASDADMPVLQAALAYDDRHVLLTLTRPQVAGPDPGQEPDPGGEPDPQPPHKPEPSDEPGPEPEPPQTPQPQPTPLPPQEPVAPQIPETQTPAPEEPGAVPEVTPIPPPVVTPPPALTWRASTHSAAIRSQLLSDSRFLRQAVLSRHAQADTLSFVGDSAIAWGQAYGASGQRRGAQGIHGTHGIQGSAGIAGITETNGTESPEGARAGQSDRRSLQGLVLGIDRILGHGWLGGAYLGLQQMRWRQQANAAQARLRTVQGGIHAEHWAGPWRMTAGAALGSTSVSGQSSGVLPDGWTTGASAWHAIPTPPSRDRYRISTRQVFVGLQYGLRHADWRLTPFMHLAWAWQTAPAHIQAGERLRVVVAKARDRVRELEAGLRLQHRAAFGEGQLQWYVQASLRHAQAPAFVAHWRGELDGWRGQGRGHGIGMAPWAGRLRIGLDYRMRDNLSFSLALDALEGAGQHDASAGFWLRWRM